MKMNENCLLHGFQKLYRPALLVLLFVLAADSNPVAAFTQARGIRSINFREFSYRVGPPYCEEFGPTVKVHQGKFANKEATFEVSRVLYGNLTGAGQEEALVVASCTPQVVAHPGFENNLVYVYGIKNDRAALLGTFAFGQPWDFKERAPELTRGDQLMLFDITGVSIAAGSISFEHMAGEARCCPTFYVTQTFRWNNGRFVLAAEHRRPWKEKSDPPKFGWKKIVGETFTLNATEHKYFRLPKGRLRFDFNAEDAVYTGVATAEQYAQLQRKYLTLVDFKSFHCVKTSINEATTQCNIQVPNAVLAVRDQRGPITRLAGAYSTVKPLGNGAIADRATTPNKVAVTVYIWTCIENCPAANP